MEIPIIAVLIGLIPAAIAQSKGRSVLGFWILSFVTLCFILSGKKTPYVSWGMNCPHSMK